MYLEGLVAIILTLGIPIVAITLNAWKKVQKNKNEMEIRRLIIENHVDYNQTKLLISASEKRNSMFKTLRWACFLCGIGIGALANFIFDIYKLYFFLMLVFGAGVGLLVAFIVEMKLTRKQQQETENPITPNTPPSEEP